MAKQHTITTYTISEHPDKDSVYEYVRDNWHDLGQFSVDECIDSLKGFSDYFGTKLDYSISIMPDRGEDITLKIDDCAVSELSGNRLRTYLVNNYSKIYDCCPFTGVCYDEYLLDVLREFIKKPDSRNFQDLMDEAGHNLLNALHAEGEYLYSDEGIHDFLETNECQFTESGRFYS